MATIGNGNDENSLKIKPSGNQGSDEVHIIIRDGKVICFEQKARIAGLECMYGDGI